MASRRWVARKERSSGAVPPFQPEPVCQSDLESAVQQVIPCSRRDAEIIKRNREWPSASAVSINDDDDNG